MTVGHGTASRYAYHACRCDDCRKAHSAYVAAQRAKNGDTFSAKVRTIAHSKAYQWMRDNHPDEFAALYAQAQAEVEARGTRPRLKNTNTRRIAP